MVRTVIIAAILGVIVASFTRPIYLWLYGKIPSQIVAAALTLMLLIVPVVALTAYSYDEVTDVAGYVDTHKDEIATRIDSSLHKFPFLQRANTQAAVRHYVIVASNYGTNILSALRSALASLAIAATIFVFTVYYVLSDADRILEYVWSRIPPRYGELSTALESNVRGVLYGAIYSTFLTQTIKTVIIFGMNVAFHVPLAAVLAIVSFIIGFFPIVGSWSVYLPVAAWLAVSRCPRPGLGDGADRVLREYHLHFDVPSPQDRRPEIQGPEFLLDAGRPITGVYTFGLVGILLGPMLIGLLKAILDTILSQPAWQWSDHHGDAGGQCV
jgi:predicted PurR-regulated permease PerM